MARRTGIDRRPFLSGLAGLLGSGALAGCLDLSSRAMFVDGGGKEQPIEFDEVASQSGFVYQYEPDEYADRKSLISDAGVYVTDFANDGRDDVLVTGGPAPVLFENVGGEFREADVLPTIEGSVSGALFFDHDNSGRDDLLVLRMEEPPLFLEHAGDEYVAGDVGFERSLPFPVTASAADYTGNGLPDVFIGQCGNWDENRPAGAVEEDVGDEDNGNPNVLYRNEGGTFTEATDAGLDSERWTLAASFVDLTGNGRPDIYTGNDYNYDMLYENRGDGTFEGRDVPDSHRNAMSAVTADLTGNHALDVFVTNIYLPKKILRVLPTHRTARKGNNLFANQGDGTFTDEAGDLGVVSGGWGWAAVVGDFDNDMRRDVFHTTEHLNVEHVMRRAYDMSPEEIYSDFPSVVYPRLFERVDDDQFLARETSVLGFEQANGRGAVGIDFDGDGSLDLAVADIDAPYKLYENAGAEGNWLRVRLSAEGTTRLGAKVYLTASGITKFAVTHANTDFLSQGPRWHHFGLGSNERATVSVHWPDGTEREYELKEVNRSVTLRPDGSVATE